MWHVECELEMTAIVVEEFGHEKSISPMWTEEMARSVLVDV